MATGQTKDGKEAATAVELKPTPKKILIVELEEAVEGLRAALVRALAAALSEKDENKIGETLSRYGLCAAPEQAAKAVISVLGVKPSSHAAIVESIRTELMAYLAHGDCRWRPAFAAALEAARGLPARVIVLSSFPEDVSAPLLSRLNPGELANLVAVSLTESTYPGPDLLLRTLREAGFPASQTTVLVSTRSSCKSALLAGLRCLAAPDRFTAHQDFGGADAVFDVESAATKSVFMEAL